MYLRWTGTCPRNEVCAGTSEHIGLARHSSTHQAWSTGSLHSHVPENIRKTSRSRKHEKHQSKEILLWTKYPHHQHRNQVNIANRNAGPSPTTARHSQAPLLSAGKADTYTPYASNCFLSSRIFSIFCFASASIL